MVKRKGCPDCRKKVYRDMDAAIGAALANSRIYGVPLRPYACPAGHGVHLTRSPLRATKR